ncbi:MAG: inosine/xanthosine triphosphatase [Nanoarchaeota archaeon]|nr:inosine/xanthosine triphosphatase [Nanoarchaeota archaeon]
MIIHVGSINRVKIEAVRETLYQYDFLQSAEVVGISVESGVGAQPLTLEDTIAGAKMRAVRAFPGSTYAVGLESGAHRIMDEKYMKLTVCSIYDGKKHHFGYSSAFEIPPLMTKLLQKGFTLERACVEAGLTQNQQIGQAQGLIGILSHGRLTRKEYTKQAIITALFALQNPQLYK